MIRRVVTVLLLTMLLSPMTAFADSAPSKKSSSTQGSSTTRRVVWTIVGAGAGFAAGLFIGLNKFDDAVDSDRKVWTAALLGAAGGGVAGGLISRNVGYTPKTTEPPVSKVRDKTLAVSWESAVGGRCSLLADLEPPTANREPRTATSSC